MGSTICTAGFPSAAIASSCFTARCDSIWYGFFIATLLFSAKENSLSAYQGWERGVATFYDLTGIPATRDQGRSYVGFEVRVGRPLSRNSLCHFFGFDESETEGGSLF